MDARFVPHVPVEGRSMPTLVRLMLFGVLVGTVFASDAFATRTPTDSARVAVDSSRVSVRHPSDTLLARFESDPAYNYEQSLRTSWWQDLRRWIWMQLTRLFGGAGAGGWVVQVVLYVVLALLVGYAGYMLVRLRSDARAPGRAAPETLDRPETAAEMRRIDYGARVSAAVERGRYREAVRLLYQKTLQHLERADAITWRPGKTNRTYVNEVRSDLRPAFADLTRLFERVWYGGRTLDADDLEQLRSHFESFWMRDLGAGRGVESDEGALHGAPSTAQNTEPSSE